MENRESVDQAKRQQVRQFVTEHASSLATQGSVVESWRQYRGRRLGPYYRLAFRREGQQVSLYLGADPRLAEEVRQELARLQSPAKQQQLVRQCRQVLQRQLAEHRATLDSELRKVGLFLKGSEVRGWRGQSRK